jgi:hypothetical protein
MRNSKIKFSRQFHTDPTDIIIIPLSVPGASFTSGIIFAEDHGDPDSGLACQFSALQDQVGTASQVNNIVSDTTSGGVGLATGIGPKSCDVYLFGSNAAAMDWLVEVEISYGLIVI